MRAVGEKNRKKQFVDNVLAAISGPVSKSEQSLKKEINALVDTLFDKNTKAYSREVTILLSDIRGFTDLSERHETSEIVRMLNNYFTHMNEIILRYGGMIDKYMGDAILSIFGVPDSRDDDTFRALACAIEMQLAMDKVNKQNKSQGLPELFVGIGINTATVSAGQVGSDLHSEYTVIGDGVNLASRIESHSLRGQVLISQYTYEKVKNVVEVGTLNKVHVKGKQNSVTLYEVISLNGKKKLQVPRREIRTSVRVEIDAHFSFQIVAGNPARPVGDRRERASGGGKEPTRKKTRLE